MLQDFLPGRKTAIDEVNGGIVEYAAEAGIVVPKNATETALVHGFEWACLEEAVGDRSDPRQ